MIYFGISVISFIVGMMFGHGVSYYTWIKGVKKYRSTFEKGL